MRNEIFTLTYEKRAPVTTQVITTREPPMPSPAIMPGLASAVARMKVERAPPSKARDNTTPCCVHGMKKARNAIRGLAIAFRVTARW